MNSYYCIHCHKRINKSSTVAYKICPKCEDERATAILWEKF